MKLLTVIIPVYNESKTITKILDKVIKTKISKQIIVVDDCSTDNSKKKISNFKSKIYKIIIHKKNLGKGAAIQSAQKFIKGKYTIIQDADLEYNPNDYFKILKRINHKSINAVYGSRVLGKKRYKLKNFTSLSRIFFNHILTLLSNIINNQRLTDAHTCYKLFDSKIFKKIKLNENGFAFCPEITTKISNLNVKIFEVPISYKGRSYDEGKKISYKDGIEAVYALFKYKFFKN
jgi:glycosyltransferase involved in cell wall biosynthesis|tara:strand:+ start:556 stop:1254 length:699 start_codon:yes stop_codon:yes gene_type:complete